jgi:hypothetical protein
VSAYQVEVVSLQRPIIAIRTFALDHQDHPKAFGLRLQYAEQGQYGAATKSLLYQHVWGRGSETRISEI